MIFNCNAKLEVDKTIEGYILPVKKKQITDNIKTPLMKAFFEELIDF